MLKKPSHNPVRTNTATFFFPLYSMECFEENLTPFLVLVLSLVLLCGSRVLVLLSPHFLPVSTIFLSYQITKRF